jgi:hypothetical protein
MISFKRLPDVDGEKRWRVTLYPLAIIGVLLLLASLA